MSKKQPQHGPLSTVRALQELNRPPTVARAIQELTEQNRPPAFASALQELNKQSRQELEKSFRLLSPSVAEQVRAAVGSISGGEQFRAAAKMNVSGSAARLIADSLGDNSGRIINESLAQSGLKSQRLLADVARGITLSDTLRETIGTIKASQIGINLKLATTGVLAEQAAFARIRIPRENLAQAASEAQWQSIRKGFASKAAEALSIAGLNAERELARLREEAEQDRERIRETLESDAAGASTAIPQDDPGLVEVPALLREITDQLRSLATQARRDATRKNLELLLIVITVVFTILSYLDPPTPSPMAPAPQVQPNRPPKSPKKGKTGIRAVARTSVSDRHLERVAV